ncbi:hypothetical protein ONS96_002561 [Cadophora gregata f. sp. sojae]|nr:hypothetical protein ONS96_002561 [Cadophora gregata f. sp. sojae]
MPEISNRIAPVHFRDEIVALSRPELSYSSTALSMTTNPFDQQIPKVEHVFPAGAILPDTGNTFLPRPPKTALMNEVTAINRHTKSVEFYGSSSSLAFLSRVQTSHQITPLSQSHHEDEGSGEERTGSLVSHLHNPVISPSASSQRNHLESPMNRITPHQHQCRLFVENFFSTVHYAYPVLTKSAFLSRCEALWSGDSRMATKTFMALYYSVLSLGALVGPRDEESRDVDDCISWSTRLFNEARALGDEMSMTTELEMVQCFFFMAQFCQHVLNPHLSYLYAGLSVRIAQSIGINREPPPETKKSYTLLQEESRTWWALYSLEIEISFAIGRPDSIGMDVFHNRDLPLTRSDPSHQEHYPEKSQAPYYGIIKCMVDLSRIIRRVYREIYLTSAAPEHKLSAAQLIEYELEQWLDNLPPEIRPMRTFASSRASISMRDARFMKRQRLFLSIRYHNVRILLLAFSLTNRRLMEPKDATLCKENVTKCLESGKETIETIHETYRNHVYFRTWFYNTTYTLFAVSTLLIYIVYEASEPEKLVLFPLVDMAISILDTMEDCIVARKAANLIRRASERAKEGPKSSNDHVMNEQSIDGIVYDSSRTFSNWGDPLNLVNGDLDSSYLFAFGGLEDGFNMPENVFNQVE